MKGFYEVLNSTSTYGFHSPKLGVNCHSSSSQSWFTGALSENRTNCSVRAVDRSSLGHLLPDCHLPQVLQHRTAQRYAVRSSPNQLAVPQSGSEYLWLLTSTLETPLCRSRSPWRTLEAINLSHLGVKEMDLQGYILSLLHILIKIWASTESNCIKPLRTRKYWTIMNS